MRNSDVGTSVSCPSKCRKRTREENQSSKCSFRRKRSNKGAGNASRRRVAVAWVDVEKLDTDNGDCSFHSIYLEPDQPYTVGRSPILSQFVFNDPRVSRRHCQLLLDALLRKLYLLDGVFSLSLDGVGCLVEEFRNRALSKDCCGKMEEEKEASFSEWRSGVKVSLNGVYLNGVKIKSGSAAELSAGDKVTIVGMNKHGSFSGAEVGFLVRRVIFQEEVRGCDDVASERPVLVQSISNGKINKRIFPPKANDLVSFRSGGDDLCSRASLLLSCCRRILQSEDPISFIRHCTGLNTRVDGTHSCSFKICDPQGLKIGNNLDFPAFVESQFKGNASAVQHFSCNGLHINHNVESLQSSAARSTSIAVHSDILAPLKEKHIESPQEASERVAPKDVAGHCAAVVPLSNSKNDGDVFPNNMVKQEGSRDRVVPPPGKKFYMNLLGSMHPSSFGHDNVVSLRELLHPAHSISRIFIATFTNDIQWFLSYCKIPSCLPVTMVCHNTVKCWSKDLDSRCSVPFPDFPNLVAVYPQFPEAIAFGKDSTKHGVACHHPKLLILQRNDFIRVIVSSANLNENQWNNISNTVWWQDFPSSSTPEYSALFTQVGNVHMHKNSNSDFAAQLAGFMAHLLADVPSQAHWITELAKYDFSGAKGYLIPSVPGIHSYRGLSVAKDMQFLRANQSGSSGMEFIGSVEASVVGLTHLYRGAVDSKGVKLKKLASFLRLGEKGYGMTKVVLRRNKNVPADLNAVSVHVPDPKNPFEGDFVQLGFLPRTIAKWVSPLWDVGFFGFDGYVCPKEALASALEGSSVKVQLILHVYKGPCFLDMAKMIQSEHVVALCSLIGSLQRSTGLWRLEEVLSQYRWPEHLESDFIYGASSIGTSTNAKFLAEFSAAAGKRSTESYDSQESDPEWGRWNVSHELRNPSVRIVFPTINRVKSARDGVLASKYMLCMAERTWERLKPVGILRDAVPHPSSRLGHPMHTKVARRRFECKRDGSSFGWVYSGSHNLSAAAWGRAASSSTKTGPDSGLRLHVCNYELGILFMFPPPGGSKNAEKGGRDEEKLDDILMPFVVPAPKYGSADRPATKQAMREVMAEQGEREANEEDEEDDVIIEEEEEEEGEGVGECEAEEKEKDEEKVYAEMLWTQLDSS